MKILLLLVLLFALFEATASERLRRNYVHKPRPKSSSEDSEEISAEYPAKRRIVKRQDVKGSAIGFG